MGLRPGGLGLVMTRAFVDDVIYNEKRNEVVLVKSRSRRNESDHKTEAAGGPARGTRRAARANPPTRFSLATPASRRRGTPFARLRCGISPFRRQRCAKRQSGRPAPQGNPRAPRARGRSVRRKEPAAVPAFAAVPAPAAGPTPIRSRSVLIAIVALSGAVIVAAMGRSRGPETAAADVSLTADMPIDVPSSPTEIEAAPPAPKTPPLPEPRTTTAAAATSTPAFAEPATPEAKPEPVEASTSLIVTPAATIDTPTSTIVGCLTFDDGAFRLKDASGIDAPKSRSWKSGFLKAVGDHRRRRRRSVARPGGSRRTARRGGGHASGARDSGAIAAAAGGILQEVTLRRGA